MKMPEKHDLFSAILAAKERQSIGAILAFAVMPFAADIMAVRLQNSNRRNDASPLSPSSFVTFSTSPDKPAISLI